jgi:hypothetical protein
MSDHHDFADHHDLPFDEPAHDDLAHEQPSHDDLSHYDLSHYDLSHYNLGHDDLGHDDLSHDDPSHDLGHDEPAADDAHDPVPEPDLPADDPADVFPPQLDVGDLPEPVDGFPWIDTGSLGTADPAALHDTALHDTGEAVPAEDLAAYAGTELPPGADPWATLAASDDPATAALARWWTEN